MGDHDSEKAGDSSMRKQRRKSVRHFAVPSVCSCSNCIALNSRWFHSPPSSAKKYGRTSGCSFCR